VKKKRQDRYDAYDTTKGKYSSRKIPKWNTRHIHWMELVDDLNDDDYMPRAANDY